MVHCKLMEDFVVVFLSSVVRYLLNPFDIFLNYAESLALFEHK
jgi:hypothetical protein